MPWYASFSSPWAFTSHPIFSFSYSRVSLSRPWELTGRPQAFLRSYQFSKHVLEIRRHSTCSHTNLCTRTPAKRSRKSQALIKVFQSTSSLVKGWVWRCKGGETSQRDTLWLKALVITIKSAFIQPQKGALAICQCFNDLLGFNDQ